MNRPYLPQDQDAQLREVSAKYTDSALTSGSGVPDRFPEPGTDEVPVAVPGSRPPMWEPGNRTDRADVSETHPLYTDVAALLDGTLPDLPAPEVLSRSDGNALFYSGQVNLVFGDPESGKTWVALAAAAETLRDGGSALVLDLDHNGVHATVQRLLMLGAPTSALRSPARFRYVEPEDHMHLVDVVADVIAWRPDVTVLDSIGELLPLFGVSSNSPDDFTMVHARVMKPLAAKAGTALVAIDHLAKNSESRALGATGTAAKRRAIGGVSLRVKLLEAFTPGRGGACLLTIHKDRHGGLRAVSPAEDKEPVAGTFRLSTIDGATAWKVHAPAGGERNPDEAADPADVDALRRLDPPPVSVKDVQERMTWRRSRAADALREYRKEPPVYDTSEESVRFRGSRTQGAEPGTAPTDGHCAVCGESSVYPIHPNCEEMPR